MKRLVVVMLFVLFSICTVMANGNSEQSGLSESEEMWKSELNDWSGKTLRLIMIGDPWIDALVDISEQFERITGAKVIVDGYGYDATHEKQILEGAQGTGDVDIFVLDAPWVGEFAEAGYVEDLRPYIEKEDDDLIGWEDYFSAFRDVSTWKDEIVGLPFAPYFVLGSFRGDLLDKAGLEIPKTAEGVKELAAYFTDNKDFPNGYGIAMNNQAGSCVGQSFFEWIYTFGGRPFKSMYPGSPDSYADMTPLFNSPEAINLINFFIDLLDYQPEGALSVAWDDRAKYFASGRVAAAFMWSVRMAQLSDPTKSVVVDKVKFGLFPSTKGVIPAPPLGGWIMGLGTKGRQKDMAWDFIKWFCSRETQKDFVMAGGPPSRYSIFSDADVKAKYDWLPVLESTVDNAYADCRPRIPESSEIISTVGTYISRAMTKELSVEDAMNSLNKELSVMLKAAGYYVSE